MKHFVQEWEAFRLTVLVPSNAGAMQTHEMQKAFYAGAQAIIFKLTRVFDQTGGDEPTLEDLRVMNDVVAELKEFFDSLTPQMVGHA